MMKIKEKYIRKVITNPNFIAVGVGPNPFKMFTLYMIKKQ